MLQNLINPCHECNHHLNGGSKDDPRCEECQKRVDYVESLGSLSESVPDDVILNGGAIVDIDEQIKIYIEKLCEEAGVWSDYLTDPEIKHDRIASPIRTKVIDKFKDIHPKILSKHLGISQSAIYQRTTRTNPKKKDATKPIKTISVPDDVDLNGGGIVDIDEQIKKYIKKLCEEAGVTPGFLMIVKHDRIANPIRSKVLNKFIDIHPKILSKHLGISQSAIYQRTTRTNPKKKDATKPIKTITKKEPEHGLHIYLPEKIYNILVLTAKAKLRTLENQAIFIIEKYIKKNETKNCS